MSLKRYVSLKK